MTFDIPGLGLIELDTLLLDLNGTIAIDGVIVGGVEDRISRLSKSFSILLLSGDTNGNAALIAKELGIKLKVVKNAEEKQKLCTRKTVAIGNGSIDKDMLSCATLGIAVIEKEGASAVALRNADIITTSINDALDILILPKRMIATLRS
ncbi:HAD hydrolase family protein [Candidatus Saccharibacteria bacterium]|jgi:soluble P-type ATPase|nr:HAD hydrolase family protein [Candidatus Saccharibacteria bacterium]